MNFIYSPDFINNLAAELIANVLESVAVRLAKRLKEDPIAAAFNRSARAAVVAMLGAIGEVESERRQHLEDVLHAFVRSPEFAEDLASDLMRGSPLDPERFADHFERAGYVAEQLPEINLDSACTSFQVEFIHAAALEPELHGIIQAGNILEQTSLQREMLHALRELATFLKDAESTGIQARDIEGYNVVGGDQHFHLPAFDPALPHGWEADYLRRVILDCDPLETQRIYAPARSAKDLDAIKVSEVFTELQLLDVTRDRDQQVAHVLAHGREGHLDRDLSESGREQDRVPVTAVEAIGAVQRLVILGQPGGGKSTLVNHLMTQIALRRSVEGQEPRRHDLSGWQQPESRLPVKIVLRRFAAWLDETKAEGDAGDVKGYIEKQCRDMGCDHAFQPLYRHLVDEGGIIFFDGLDEVREHDALNKRTSVLRAIEAFARPLEKCKVVITCREYAYRAPSTKDQPDWRLPESLFPVVELALFNSEQIESFVRGWYQASGPIDQWEPELIESKSQELVSAIERLPHLRELAPHPILLTLMTQIHGTEGALPDSRATLYEKAIELLLARWDNWLVGSEISLSPGEIEQMKLLRLEGVSTKNVLRVLQRLAFEAHERQEHEEARDEQAADIPRIDLLDALKARYDANTADAIAEYVQTRAGLLQAVDTRTYRFPHRTFQEYLAAVDALQRSEPTAVLERCVRRDLNWWREVCLLAAGASGVPSVVQSLADRLLPRELPETGSPQPNADLIAVAAQALHETDFVQDAQREADERGLANHEPGPYVRVLDRARRSLISVMQSDATVSARRRAAAGDWLGRLGDPRFDPEHWFLQSDDMLGFVEIPEDEFWMGAPDTDDLASPDEKSCEKRTCFRFYASRFPVTVSQYRAFEDSTGRPHTDAVTHPHHPMTSVSWNDATAFAAWLDERLKSIAATRLAEATDERARGLWSGLASGGLSVVLPSEIEWEKAARGPADGSMPKRRFPWGDTPNPNHANYGSTGISRTSAVGCFFSGRCPYKCEEMSGNVWEWTRSEWRSDLSQPDDGLETRDQSAARRVLRGGSFLRGQQYVRCSGRGSSGPDYRNPGNGFRVVVSPFLSDR